MVRETHSPTVDGPPSTKLAPKDSQPLQQLSPERVNGVYNTSSTMSTTTKQSNGTDLSPVPSPQASPTRRAKANLFADYDPNRGSPTKGSMVLGGGIPQSPSLPEITALRSHGRTNSDVQGLVKRFEHLDVRDRDAESAERMKRREAELRRALMAREEAETDSKRLRAEIRKLERLADEGAEREHIVGRRVEVLTEELAASKEASSTQRETYEKEIRKARKEAFKTSSAVVKLQEELKNTRNGLRCAQQDREMEKQKAQQKEQERFEMEYQLIPLQEELNKLERHLKAAQQETLALKASLKEEEVARIAAEGRIPLPMSQDTTDEFASPKKQSPFKRPASPLSDDKENLRSASKKTAESKRIADELEREKLRRLHAEELADFLQMECNFRCCGCKRASRLGHELSLSLDGALSDGILRIREGMHNILGSSEGHIDHDRMDVEHEPTTKEGEGIDEKDFEAEDNLETTTQPTDDRKADDVNRSMTFAAESPRVDTRSANLTESQPQNDISSPAPTQTTTSVPLQLATPPHPNQDQEEHQPHETTPFRPQPSIRTVTTTTTIPMHFTPVSKAHHTHFSHPAEDAENIPPPNPSATSDPNAPTFDRAAALAAIEYRRGRAKSLANGQATPRKQMMEGVGAGGRRDISAPALGQKSGNVGGGSAVKGLGTASVGRAGGMGRRG